MMVGSNLFRCEKERIKKAVKGFGTWQVSEGYLIAKWRSKNLHVLRCPPAELTQSITVFLLVGLLCQCLWSDSRSVNK